MTRITLVLIVSSSLVVSGRRASRSRRFGFRLLTRSRADLPTAIGLPRARRAARREGRGHTADLGDKPTFNANAGYSRTNHVLNFRFSTTRRQDRDRIPRYSRQLHNAPCRFNGRSTRRAEVMRSNGRRPPKPRPPVPTSRRREPICVSRSFAPIGRAVTAREAERRPRRVDRARGSAGDRCEAIASTLDLIPPNEVSSARSAALRERAQLIEATNIRERARSSCGD